MICASAQIASQCKSMKSPSAPQENSSRQRNWLIPGIALLVLLVAAYFVARPAYHRLKAWRTRYLIAQSGESLAHGDWPQAKFKAHAALLLSPNDPDALRAMAQVLSRGTNQPAMAVWQRLLQTGKATANDRRNFVEQALRAGAGAAAANELDKLINEEPSHPVSLWLAAQLFAAAGDREQTIYYASRARLNDPTNQQYQLFLSSLRFDSKQPEQLFAAHSNVWEVAAGSSPLALEALTFLAQRPELSSDQRVGVATLLRQHPAHTIAHELLALGLEITATPARRAEVLDAAVAHYRTASPETRVQFAIWLNQNEEFQRTLAALPLDEALKRKDFFLPHAEALMSQRQWQQLKNILESKHTPLEQPYLEGFRARCDKELGNASQAESHWQQAVHAAGQNTEQLFWVALYAEKCNEPLPAKQALRSLISHVEHPQPAYQVLERVTEHFGTTAELRDLLGEMVKRWPDDISYQNDFAYLNALLNTAVAGATTTAEALVNRRPASLPHRTTLALALYRQQDFVRALGAYGNQRYNWEIALPGQRAVYAAVLAANGRTDQASQVLRGLNRSQLRPEELQLIAALP
jgi:hypothetical protein